MNLNSEPNIDVNRLQKNYTICDWKKKETLHAMAVTLVTHKKFQKRKVKRVFCGLLLNSFFIDCKVHDFISSPGFTHVSNQ